MRLVRPTILAALSLNACVFNIGDVSGTETRTGDAHIEGLDEDAFSIAVTGSGDVEAGGEADAVTVSVSGSGDIGARGLQVETARIDVHGSGNVSVTASDTATGSISGSGDVTVHGGASCQIAVTGSGDVNC